ncbi:MAG: CHAT domain-containing protein [Gammaproteobacteria bacterium]|jgi:hypothetical protein|nr:CHAT domain-containing protein [Gammaproteobacteria bacterium]MBT5603257.1 CHAT domain-containing protein [Gammaproteobacteria bacterium]MBT6244757.1 CHAT domain-containing protein [Gammaproteobacteria bacterium]
MRIIIGLCLVVAVWSVSTDACARLYLTRKVDSLVAENPIEKSIRAQRELNALTANIKPGKAFSKKLAAATAKVAKAANEIQALSAIQLTLPSVSENGQFLALGISNQAGGKITSSYGVLVDFTRGELLSSKSGLLAFEGNLLMKSDISDPANPAQYWLDRDTLQVKERIHLPAGEIYGGTERGYLKTMPYVTVPANRATSLYRFRNGEYEKVGSYPLVNGTVSADGSMISGLRLNNRAGPTVAVYDIESEDLIKDIAVQGIQTYIDSRSRLFISYMDFDPMSFDPANPGVNFNLKIIDLYTGAEIHDLPGQGGNFQVDDSGRQMMVAQRNGVVNFIDLTSYQVLGQDAAFYVNPGDIAGATLIPVKIGEGDFFVIGSDSGISKLVSAKERRVIADIYADENDWAVVAVDGRVDGTQGAFKKLQWREYDVHGQVIAQASLDTMFDNFFTPGLLPTLMHGPVGTESQIRAQIAGTPDVTLMGPLEEINSAQATISVVATAKGDPIKVIQVYVNDKLVSGDYRGLIISGKGSSFTVPLVAGRNVISAKAVTRNNYESSLARLEVLYDAKASLGDMHILAVGLDQYKNTAYNLNYATADARSIVEAVRFAASDIFNRIRVHELYDVDATREMLIETLKVIADQSKPEDVFVLFYAGHGVMSDDKRYYLALHNVLQLYGRDDLLSSEGLSADELKVLTSDISAQKQMIILDACQSGAAVETFAVRGVAEEKAIVQLARSSGAVLLASTGTEQYASEFDDLGHGVFTYALLEGLSGQADGGQRDNKITIKELEAYLNDSIPVLTDKYHGSPQYPRSWSRGQDFPLVMVK